jgi:ferritin-like metal-binding protein YciE
VEATGLQCTVPITKEAIMAKQPKTLDDLFHDTLKDIYFAEKKILATLPKLAKAAQSPDLKKAFEKHRGETEGHVARLEKVLIQGLARARRRFVGGCSGGRAL